ncbi:MAG: ABC transporter ATP-binding protein, partial [Clostridia bacterium]|nr:ABC transporter ATP-binding protein [Clostridia bacterium]
MNKHPRGVPGPGGRKINFKTLKRVLSLLFKAYPRLIPIALVCIVFSAIVSSVPAIFQQKVLAVITSYWEAGNTDWSAAKQEILPLVLILVGLYVLSIICITLQTQLMAVITQGYLNKMRRKMFDGMQSLPIRFFDTHKHGDIMSHYTNDIDTLRQLVSQSIPSVLQAAIIATSVLTIMLWYSVWMTLVVLLGVFALMFVTGKVGGGSAKFFMRQQKAMGKSEGFVQEMMNGQKVIKVFCHEDEIKAEFDEINEQLCQDSFRAHAYANCLGPINMNIGNILYVLCATAGGLFLLSGMKNVSLSGLAFTIDIIIPFLNMTKQFTGNVNQFSQQINSIVMALAGATRIFDLVDQIPEVDDGYVTLVNCEISEDGVITETDKHTGKW